MPFTIAALVFSAALVGWYLWSYNALVRAENAVDQAWANIEVELKRRFELIANLVETARGYARHENQTFRDVAELRARAPSLGTAADANPVQGELTRAVRGIMILAENYPQLRADQAFLKLHSELTETENRIATRRLAYNQTVNLYQNLCQAIPTNLPAGIHDFPARAFFDAPDELAAAAPEVRLS